MKPKIYPKDEHGIDINLIDSKALYILEKLRISNYISYLVGGSVRDLLLSKQPKDFDISTSAKPEEIKALFPSSILIGKRFRLAHVRFGRKTIEVSTFRSGDIENEQLITEDNIWGNPEQDVRRRDFTINGLFYDSKEETIIDYVGGYEDIKKKYLRSIGQAYLRFKQDPVRMIRCLKFRARYGFEVDEKARQALIECKTEIIKSAPARVLEELLRMLESGSAYPFFKFMTSYGLLEQLLPQLAEFLETAQGNEVYDYLKEVDEKIQENHRIQLKRPVLLACSIFPLLERDLKTHYIDREKTPHLGEIYQIITSLIESMFRPFFKLPRRLKTHTTDLLVSQYRITPFSKRKKERIRIPKISHFEFALQFLELRARIEPSLQEITKLWLEEYKKTKEKKHFSDRKKKRKKHFSRKSL